MGDGDVTVFSFACSQDAGVTGKTSFCCPYLVVLEKEVSQSHDRCCPCGGRTLTPLTGGNVCIVKN